MRWQEICDWISHCFLKEKMQLQVGLIHIRSYIAGRRDFKPFSFSQGETSGLDYCNVLYMRLHLKSLQKLQLSRMKQRE